MCWKKLFLNCNCSPILCATFHSRQSNVSPHCYIPYMQFSVVFPHYPFCLDIRSYLFASKSHRITTTHRSSAKSVSASCLRAVIIQRTEKSKNICFEKKREKSVILFLNLQLSRLNVNKMCWSLSATILNKSAQRESTWLYLQALNQDYSLENQERGRGLRKMERNMRNWFGGGFLCTVYIRLTALSAY